MFRYVSLVWDVTNPSVTHEAELVTRRLRLSSSDWISAFDKDGLRVLCTGHRTNRGRSYLLPNDGGIVVGKLFRRNQDPKGEMPPRDPILDSSDAIQILRTNGRALIDSHWGWYVAFLANPARHEKWILRGPMSDLPCFHVSFRGVSLFFSWVEDCAALGLMRLTVDWNYVGLQVAFGASVRIGQTAINEVSSIAGGECVQIRAESVLKSVYWNPCTVAKARSIDDPQEAASMLRATVRSCVHAWASDHPALLLRLSGGFDSSVVLECLRDAPNRPRVTCINYYSSGAMGDEREFARAICRRAGAELIEQDFGNEGSLEIIRTVRRTCAPTNDVIDWQENDWEHVLARAKGATAVFMGSLGDMLFVQSGLLWPAADYLHQKGFNGHFAKVVFDVAQNNRVSVWKVLSHAILDGLLKPPKGTWNPYEVTQRARMVPSEEVLMCGDAIRNLRKQSHRLVHPWLRAVDGVPPGKLLLIAGVAEEGYYASPFKETNDPPIIAPFLSQPLTELCLQIPTYLSVMDGWDRAMARRAFARELPPEIIRRSAKGSPSSWLKGVINREAPFIREFLLEGILVREGVLDRAKLEQALPGAPTKTGAYAGHILNLLYTEAWLRSWSEDRRCATAVA